MLHHVGQGEKKEWPKLVYLSNVITWRGFGNTNKKKKTKAKRESGGGQMKRERGKRRKKKKKKKKKKKQQQKIWGERIQQQKIKA